MSQTKIRSLSEINDRLNRLKSREKDGVNVSEEIFPLEYFLSFPQDITEQERNNNIKDYIIICIENDQYKRAVSAIWLLNK